MSCKHLAGLYVRNALSLSNWDVGQFGAGTQKLASLSGLDAVSTLISRTVAAAAAAAAALYSW